MPTKNQILKGNANYIHDIATDIYNLEKKKIKLSNRTFQRLPTETNIRNKRVEYVHKILKWYGYAPNYNSNTTKKSIVNIQAKVRGKQARQKAKATSVARDVFGENDLRRLILEEKTRKAIAEKPYFAVYKSHNVHPAVISDYTNVNYNNNIQNLNQNTISDIFEHVKGMIIHASDPQNWVNIGDIVTINWPSQQHPHIPPINMKPLYSFNTALVLENRVRFVFTDTLNYKQLVTAIIQNRKILNTYNVKYRKLDTNGSIFTKAEIDKLKRYNLW